MLFRSLREALDLGHNFIGTEHLLLGLVRDETEATMGVSVGMEVLGKLGVRGYQPYERLGLWLRRELRPLVRRLLLSDRCLGRGIFEPQTINAVVENHLSGRRNHTFLLMALMVFETGQREFIDGPCADGAPGDRDLLWSSASRN